MKLTFARAAAAAAAGIDLHMACWSNVERGTQRFTLHAETSGELQYALAALEAEPDIFTLAPD